MLLICPVTELRTPWPLTIYDVVELELPLSEQWIVTNAEGESLDYREGKKHPAQPQYALCRCGQSANKPFCDGAHARTGFSDPVEARELPPPKPRL